MLVDFSAALLQIIFGLLLLSFYHPYFIFFSIFLVAVLVLVIRLTGPQGLKSSLYESKFKYQKWQVGYRNWRVLSGLLKWREVLQ